MFAGNKETASRALPSKIIVGESIESKSISEFSKNFAPFNERGCFVVVIDTDPLINSPGGAYWEVEVPEVSAREEVVDQHQQWTQKRIAHRGY